MSKINVAIIGVGNCASALIQGRYYYSNIGEKKPGLTNPVLAGYRVSDIEFVAAFDVTTDKVGVPLHEAVYSYPNNVSMFYEVPSLPTMVERGPTLDGMGSYHYDITESDKEPVNIYSVLLDKNVDVVINYLPVGSQKATEWYVEQSIKAGCAFINCVPVFIASDENWARKFKRSSLPIIGDDIKSQVGATILHRVISDLCVMRGINIKHTYQLNFGGNADFLNMLERSRLVSKKISKTQAVNSILDKPLSDDDIHVGPSDHVAWLGDTKICYINIDGVGFGGLPLEIEAKLKVCDSPNSGGIVIDTIRVIKAAKDAGYSGPLIEPSAYYMKSPPTQFVDSIAKDNFDEFLENLE